MDFISGQLMSLTNPIHRIPGQTWKKTLEIEPYNTSDRAVVSYSHWYAKAQWPVPRERHRERNTPLKILEAV